MPVNLVNAESVSHSYGVRRVLADVSLGIADGDRVGIVGLNGSGKTTLLRLLAGAEDPDSGRVTRGGGVRLAVLAQGDELPAAATVRDVVIGRRREHDWAADRAARDIVDTLVGRDGLERVVGTLSGGERRRVALAAALLDDTDVLLLDEPTNHLDIDVIDWLARHLVTRRGALAVITHDRWFLDAVCTRTWEVDDARVVQYDGGYAEYVLARAERSRVAAVTEERRQNLLRKELAWLRRGPPARTSKPRFRIDAANALIAAEPPARDRAALARFSSARLGRTVFDLEDASLSLGGRRLLDDATWRVGPGERIGLVAPNGAGKTTLLRVLAGRRPLDAGTVRTGTTVRIGFLSQHVAELEQGLRVLEAVEAIRRHIVLGDGRELSASALLDRFGFTGQRQWTPVGDLSGGERRRLQLLRLLMDEPNVLLLDEPTNDLDVDTLTALEDLLDGWAGTLIAASHDRYFLERVCDEIVALVDAKPVGLPGGVDEYLQSRRAVVADAAPPSPAREANTARPANAAREARPANAAREARKTMARIERRLGVLETRERDLHERLAEAASDYAAVQQLDAELTALTDERTSLEAQWLQAAEESDG